MKTIRIFFIVCVCCCFTPLFAQDEMGSGYLFPQFEKGTVVFKKGMKYSTLLNYNIFVEEMLFLESGSTVMALDNISDILVIIIGERRFFPANSKGMFYEEVQSGNGSFFIQHKAVMLSEGKASAYGGYSQTSAISQYESINDSGTGNIHKLSINEKFKMKIDNSYYIQSGKNYKRFYSAKTLGKLFKGKEAKIEAFAKENSINFSKAEDIAKIVEYGYSF